MRIAATPVAEIAALIGARIQGDESIPVTGFNEIHRVSRGDCAFVDHPKYYDKCLGSAATVIIINQEVSCPPGKVLLIHPEPFTAFNKLTRHFNPPAFFKEQFSPSARTGADTILMHGCVIGANVVIGNNCIIHPNVVLYPNTIIGNNVVIHANTTVGSDAFYFRKRDASFEALYSCGHVEIEDHVTIGSNCSIDRGVTDVTRIGHGTIIDNHVHIAHDVLIGRQCLFAAQVGIAGACTIGDKVTMWGQVGVSSGITIGNGATILAQSGVGENVPANATYFGTPAGPAREKMKEVFSLKQLPGLIGQLYRKD